MYNFLGIKQAELKAHQDSGEQQYRINLENLPEGYYIIKLMLDGQLKDVKKVILKK